MVIHVSNPEVDALVRELARTRGISISAAVKLAAKEALLLARIREFQRKVLSRSATGLEADKAFFDELSGDVG